MPWSSPFYVTDAWHAVTAQELLGMSARVQSVSPYVVSPCGQKLLNCSREATFADNLSNATLLAEEAGPFVDAVLTSDKCAAPPCSA